MEWDIRPSDRGRILKFIDEKEPDSCWNWNGKSKHRYGYGSFTMRTTKGAFRGIASSAAVWMILVGPIPTGLHVLHNCDNPLCCNIKHLRLGTHQENMQDRRDRKTHYYSRMAHCINGHVWTPENTCVLRTGPEAGNKRCRECRRISMRKNRPRKD